MANPPQYERNDDWATSVKKWQNGATTGETKTGKSKGGKWTKAELIQPEYDFYTAFPQVEYSGLKLAYDICLRKLGEQATDPERFKNVLLPAAKQAYKETVTSLQRQTETASWRVSEVNFSSVNSAFDRFSLPAKLMSAAKKSHQYIGDKEALQLGEALSDAVREFVVKRVTQKGGIIATVYR